MVVHLSSFQTFNSLCENIVNLFVQIILFVPPPPPFGFSWRLFSKVELRGRRMHMVGLWLPGPRRGRCQCPGPGTRATALTRVWEGQCPRSGCGARAGEPVHAEPAGVWVWVPVGGQQLRGPGLGCSLCGSVSMH